jgi:hypothetical protein
MATARDDIARIGCRLKREPFGPFAVIMDTATSSLLKQFGRTTDELRQTVFNRPMIALLISFDVGFAFARTDRRHAPR